MKQNLLEKLATGMMLLALPLVFNSCGNVDNPLEEIVNNVSTPPVFMKFNPATQKWETIDLSKVDYTKLDETYVKNLIKEGELTLTPGKYLVQGNVTVNANVFSSGAGALQILLSDGSRLQINGAVCCADEVPLEIYGQTANTGVMSVNSTDGNSAVRTDELVVGGANLITDAKGAVTAAIEVIGSFEQHAGTVKATTDNASPAALISGDANIYGGRSEFASADGRAVWIEGNAKIGYDAMISGNVYGGYSESDAAGSNVVWLSAQGATGAIQVGGTAIIENATVEALTKAKANLDDAQAALKAAELKVRNANINIKAMTDQYYELMQQYSSSAAAISVEKTITIEGGKIEVTSENGVGIKAANVIISDPNANGAGGTIKGTTAGVEFDGEGNEGKLTVEGGVVKVEATGSGTKGVNGDLVFNATDNNSMVLIKGGEGGMACNNVIIGENARQRNAVAYGTGDGVNWDNIDTGGQGSTPVNYNSIAIGYGDRVTGDHSGAFGD